MRQDDDMEARRGGALARQPISEPEVGPGGDPVTTGLQRLFDSIAQEPIPDDFLRLLDEIEARGAEAPSQPAAAYYAVVKPDKSSEAP